MADSDQIFLALTGDLELSARRVAEVLGLQPNGGRRPDTGEWQFKVGARTFDGVIGVYVGQNHYLPEPGEPQAMDGYAVVVDVQARQRKDAQAEEARLAFETLVAGLPEVPALLSDNVEFLVAAYLPGKGVHVFPSGTTVDVDDAGIWQSWVVNVDE